MINVLAVFQDFSNSSAYYSYNNFVQFTIEERIWNKNECYIFPNQMKDLKGSTLPVFFGGPEPAVIVSKLTNGDTLIGGFVGHIFNYISKKHNAKLNSSNVNTLLSVYEMHTLALNGTIEISGSHLVVLQDKIDMSSCSYPYILVDWSIMLTIEIKIPLYKVFAFVFHWEAFVLTICAFIFLSVLLELATEFSGSQRIDCFRGILGQSFPEARNPSFTTKIIYLLIFMLGIMIVTSYDAFLQSFMTELPREKVIRSFDDLESSGLKIFAFKGDMDELLYKWRPNFMKRYSNIFQVENNGYNFVKFRDTLNTKYAFTVNSPKWEIFKNQQNFFDQQLFRWSDELCLLKNLPMAIAINENSIYKQILNKCILEMQSAGLIEFWKRRAFYELTLYLFFVIKKLLQGLLNSLELLNCS
ncbi:uncharacterized protein LOC129918164 [Episyrphus balteatus]|uniref:uncharacterized protein LOC129918164 n=1 Tax=Episyrphus balteatus TaxID=286459 RepID=UPI0024868F34|nr:uncharacterized protein LOC129918164 [Episyrphus balteatus]